MSDAPTEGRRCVSAVLRPLTGHEEEWLAHHRAVPSAIAVTRILDACVRRLDDDEPPPEPARRMLVGDRDYLMLQLRRLMFGDKIRAVIACPACTARMDVDVDAGQIPVEGPTGKGAATYAMELPAREGLPGRPVRFRLPTGGDQEAVLGMEIEAAAAELLDRCLLDGGAAALCREEQDTVIAAIEARAPRVEVELELDCPECAEHFVCPFDTTAFFLDEMRISSAQLLREVHTLAFYYHWSESEILSLARDRRRSYLELLGETLRQE
jgi:hypothetical protein